MGPLGARETGGRDIAFQGRGEMLYRLYIPFLDALYAGDTLYAFSAFPVLHVSALPGGQICAMNKIAAKLRMKVYENMISLFLIICYFDS